MALLRLLHAEFGIVGYVGIGGGNCCFLLIFSVDSNHCEKLVPTNHRRLWIFYKFRYSFLIINFFLGILIPYLTISEYGEI